MRYLLMRATRPGSIAGLGALLVVLIAWTPRAFADEMTVYSCHTPGGAATGTGGWSEAKSTTGAIGTFMLAENTCAGSGTGGLVSELPSRAAAWSDGEGILWTFAPGFGGAIVDYVLEIAGTYANPGGTGIGAGNVAVAASDESDPIYDYRNLGGGSRGAVTIERTPSDEVKSITLLTSCDAFAGPCPVNELLARSELASASFLLNDESTPKASSVGGPLTEGRPVSGPSEVSFEASDSGPGIYAAHLVVDGQAQPSAMLDSNGGHCVNLGETTNGTRAFDSPEPCAKSVDGAMSLETTEWVDGTHHVQLILEDASGNSVSAFNGEVTFDNAPVETGEPRFEAVHEEEYDPEHPTENAAEARAEGSFAAPAGAGAVRIHSFWERCDATGANCAAISGATGAIYDFTASDVGSTIRYATMASDRDGSTTVASTPSAVIKESEPPSHPGLGSENPLGGTSITNNSTTNNTTTNGGSSTGNGAGSFPLATFSFTGLTAEWTKSLSGLTRSYPRSALRLTGRLLSPSGQPLGGQTVYLLSGPLGGGLAEVAQTVTDPNGNWALKAPKGPSRLLRVAYGAQSASAAGTQLTRDIVEDVRPVIEFHVRSYGAGILAFRAHVRFARTSPALLAVVQARKGRRWQDVGAPERLNGRGVFTSRYSASALIGNTYVFRLYVPATHLALSAASKAVSATVR